MTNSNTRAVRSMTGQGHAVGKSELGVISVEVRTVNNRGFKCSPRLSDALSSLESKIESLVRSLVHRGTVQLSVVWRRPPGDNLPTIDAEALRAYVSQLEQVQSSTEVACSIDLSTLLSLPGVVVASREDRRDDEALWEFVRGTIEEAIDNLNEMRSAEGDRMAESLRSDVDDVQKRLETIQSLTPRAVETYRNRLETKIQRVLQEHNLDAGQTELLREVQIYADRVDVSEEITRLGSHLQMFSDVLGGAGGERPEPTGRKLDFIIQEMFRETNTIGSKASDAEISAHVVEIKCAIERMRELVQNLE